MNRRLRTAEQQDLVGLRRLGIDYEPRTRAGRDAWWARFGPEAVAQRWNENALRLRIDLPARLRWYTLR